MTNMDKLTKWIHKHSQTIHTVLISGDIANSPMDWNPTQEAVQEYLKNLETIVHVFSSSYPVYYIPGNHDVLLKFQEESVSPRELVDPPSPCNLHMKTVQLMQHLHIVGLGGSVPGYQGGDKIWEGFPYRTYEDFDVDLHKLLDPLFFDAKSHFEAEDAVIFMTHCGPAETDTTYVRLDPLKPIVSGSPEMIKMLSTENMQKHIIMNIHGHSHFSPGQTVVGKTRILNPGPMQDGCFGVYTLRQRQTDNHPTWEIASVSFHVLPSS